MLPTAKAQWNLFFCLCVEDKLLSHWCKAFGIETMKTELSGAMSPICCPMLSCFLITRRFSHHFADRYPLKHSVLGNCQDFEVLFAPLMYLRFGWKSFSFNLKYGLDPGPRSLRHHRHDFGDCFLFTVFCHSWFMNTWTKDHISPAAVLHAAAYIMLRNSCIVARNCPCMGPILSDRIFNTFYVDII